jgi:predicted O-linked N-acetylglucosamine transferase (SPINDLY family)
MADQTTISPEVEALFDRALALHESGDYRAAAVAYQECTVAAPSLGLAWGNLGRCLASLGLHHEALVAYKQAVSLGPQEVDFYPHAAMSFRALDDMANARAALSQVLAIDPHHVNSLIALGVIETEANNYLAAKELLGRALTSCPANPTGDHYRSIIWNNLGSIAYRGLKDLSSAEEAYRRAAAINPNNSDALNNYALALVDTGRAEEGIGVLKKALQVGGSFTTHSNLLNALLYTDTYSPEQVRAEHEAWGKRVVDTICNQWGSLPQPPQHATWGSLTEQRRPLRVGYLTADFRAHTTSQFLLPALSRHTSLIELFLYANFATPDAITEAFMKRANHFRSVVHLSDQELNKLIRSDPIDILVECSGHTLGHRLSVLPLRPAPIICSWVGYPATTGIPTVDYRLVDELTDPQGYDSHCSEKLIRLEGGFNCFQPHSEPPPVCPPPTLTNGYITFGSANNVRKISQATLGLWGAILQAVPTARMRIKSIHLDVPAAQEHILKALASHGIDQQRIDLVGYVAGQNDHLSFYHSVDIALDTIPYNGTTTTCDALTMGVPLIALVGNSHVSRVSYSILERAGLGDLVAKDHEEYVTLAVTLASQSNRLRSLRASLRSMLYKSPLGQYDKFVAQLESAYFTMCGL